MYIHTLFSKPVSVLLAMLSHPIICMYIIIEQCPVV